MTEEIDPAVVRRMIWLLVVPVGSSFVPWLALLLDHGGRPVLFAVAAAPLLGALAAFAYAIAPPLPVRWWPMLPYLLAAGAFLIALIAASNLGADSDGLEFVPVLVIGFFQPLLALVGGLISYVWASPKRQPASSIVT